MRKSVGHNQVAASRFRWKAVRTDSEAAHRDQRLSGRPVVHASDHRRPCCTARPAPSGPRRPRYPPRRKGSQLPVGLVSLHGEQAHLALQRIAFFDHAPRHHLEIPDDVVQVEGDLLTGLVANDVDDFFDFDRRRLEELCQTALPWDADADHFIDGLVAFKKLLQCLGDELIGVRFGLAQDFGVLDVVKRIGDDLAVLDGAAECLQRGLADFDSPNALTFCHRLLLQNGVVD